MQRYQLDSSRSGVVSFCGIFAWYTWDMNKLTRLIFTIAAIIVTVWLVALLFRVAAWIINGLLYVAAIVVIVGLVRAYIQRQKPQSSAKIDDK